MSVKVTKRILCISALFFCVVIALCSAILFAGCGNEQPTNQKESQTQEGENFSLQPKYYTSLSTNDLHLVNNGVGVEFIVTYLPTDMDGEISIEISNENIVNFGANIIDSTGLVDFTTEGNILYPISCGSTTITISAEGEDGPIIETCEVQVSEYEESFDLSIFDEDGNGVEHFKSNKKADNTFEKYVAKLTSLRNLSDVDFEIVKSEQIAIIENSKSSVFENNQFVYSFEFYIKEGITHSLKIELNEQYENYVGTTKSNLIQITATEFLQDFSINISNGEDSPNMKGNKYLLHFAENENYIQEMELNTYFNSYVLSASNGGENLSNIQFQSSNERVAKIETVEGNVKIIATSVGNAEITVSANDGSGLSKTFEVCVEKIMPSEISIINKENSVQFGDYSTPQSLQSALSTLIGDQHIYLQNDFDKPTCFQLCIDVAPYYAQTDYVYFTVRNSVSGLSIENNPTLTATRKIATTFSGVSVGEYIVDLVVKGQVIYSFDVSVSSVDADLMFSAEDFDNVIYSFTEITSLIEVEFLEGQNNYIEFEAKLFVDKKVVSNTQITFIVSDETLVECDPYQYNAFYFDILGTGEFTITLTEQNSGIEKTITVIVS